MHLHGLALSIQGTPRIMQLQRRAMPNKSVIRQRTGLVKSSATKKRNLSSRLEQEPLQLVVFKVEARRAKPNKTPQYMVLVSIAISNAKGKKYQNQDVVVVYFHLIFMCNCIAFFNRIMFLLKANPVPVTLSALELC